LRAIEDRFERISALMRMLELEHRIVLTKEDIEKNSKIILEEIDYTKVETILDTKRHEFYAFVQKNII
jgi:hypothetical protein